MPNDNATAVDYLNYLNSLPRRSRSESIVIEQEKVSVMIILDFLEHCLAIS